MFIYVWHRSYTLMCVCIYIYNQLDVSILLYGFVYKWSNPQPSYEYHRFKYIWYYTQSFSNYFFFFVFFLLSIKFDSTMSSNLRTRKDRRKIEMKMTNKSNLQVPFSKRRSGVLKKASELCTLCGAEVCLIIFSPSEKVFSIGHPNVDTVVHRYLIEAATTRHTVHGSEPAWTQRATHQVHHPTWNWEETC